MSNAHQLDPETIHRFVAEHIEGLTGPLQIEQISGGQSNPTYILDYGHRRLVLRKRPPGELLPSAHAVDREYRVQKALRDSGVPVPEVLLLHMEPDVIGTAFYLMEHVSGRVFHDCTLPGVTGLRRAMYQSAARTLARLHEVDVAAVGLSDFGRAGSYFERQVTRWHRQWQLSSVEPNSDIETLVDWLKRNMPPESGRAGIAHGDFRIGNVMYYPDQPDVVAVLDWELATLGEPLADLAHFCAFTWHMGTSEYGGLLGVDLAAAELPSQDEFCETYYAAAPGSGRMTPFHIAFALFRNAAIFEGIAARARSGNAASANATTVGKLSGVLARRAVSLLEKA
jgi:aminoglycoside phosphotransferase (APT) family kinase protein